MRARSWWFLVLSVALAACRSTRPAGVETPVTALDRNATERSLMHIRATSGDRVESFRAQLLASPRAMLFNIYTPLGTSFARIYATSDRVLFLNDFENTTWSGTPAEFAQAFGFFGDANPLAMADLILGRRTSFPGVNITYEPNTFPPKHVVVTQGARRLEIEHLESVYTTAAVEEPQVPRNYRCCVPPRL